MGELLIAMGRLSEAEKYLEKSLDTSERVYGRGHPTTVELIGLTGELRRAQANYDEAEMLLLECFNVNATTRSMGHEKTRDAIEEVVVLYETMGNTEEAQKYRAKLPEPATSPEPEEIVVDAEEQ
jgi:tetratricopeptide (TPR) repeat protein